ncbi:hypothetical protein SRABI133_01012 [Peribacillus simplex]|uniref:Uncharacterized protein n=1 Tax=Peribacillus simplex TaxID=1478 RepID=A0A9W4KRP6_9BACI|nr:hypothetical protein SRABI133_01012 [Peribacillus simplex]
MLFNNLNSFFKSITTSFVISFGYFGKHLSYIMEK